MGKNGYIFYFDESFHDRRITNSSIRAKKYYNSYTSVGIGIKKNLKEKGLRKFRNFEKKYKKKFSVNELKSEVVKEKKYRHGLATFNKLDLSFYFDFFNILYCNDFIYYISSCDKVEYLLMQCKYKKSICINDYAMIYAIVKAINIYKPKGVIEKLFNKDKTFFDELKCFLESQVIKNGNIKLKQYENIAFEQLINFLDNIDTNNIDFDFSYYFVYFGLEKLMQELKQDICETKVIIDEEGQGKILSHSKEIGFKNSIELNSKKCAGVRIADLLCGFISRFMQGLYMSTYNDSREKYVDKHYIQIEWFKINKNQFELYKNISRYIKKYNDVYYCSYISLYGDLFAEMIGIISYFDNYNSYEEYICESCLSHYEKCNISIVNQICENLEIIENICYNEQ